MSASARKYKDSKPKLFLVFLLLAVFFWVLTKFSKEYIATVQAGIDYENLPANTLLTQSNQQQLQFDLQANGFEFLYYRFKQPRVSLDVGSYFSQDSTASQVTISNSDLAKTVTTQLDKNQIVTNLYPAQITVLLNDVISKKVAIRPISLLEFREGFKAVDSIKAQPDSVLIAGPSEIIDEIHFIATTSLQLSQVDQDIAEVVDLVVRPEIKVQLPKAEVLLSAPVREYTQKQMQLPVQLINVPSTVSVKLIPEQVMLSFDVSVEDFKTIGSSSFRLVCDYAKRNEAENFMLPELLESPKGIQHVELSHKKIDYLIFRR